MKLKVLIGVSLLAIIVLISFYYQQLNQKRPVGQVGQTKFCNLKKAGGEGIARLRYDQNLTIELLPQGEYDFVVKYTVETEEEVEFEEFAEIYLDSESLVAFDVTPTELSWEGDLIAGEPLTLGAGIMVTKNSGKFLQS